MGVGSSYGAYTCRHLSSRALLYVVSRLEGQEVFRVQWRFRIKVVVVQQITHRHRNLQCRYEGRNRCTLGDVREGRYLGVATRRCVWLSCALRLRQHAFEIQPRCGNTTDATVRWALRILLLRLSESSSTRLSLPLHRRRALCTKRRAVGSGRSGMPAPLACARGSSQCVA